MKSSFGRQERRRDRRVRQTKEGGYYHIVLSGKLVITEENGREPTRGGVVFVRCVVVGEGRVRGAEREQPAG